MTKRLYSIILETKKWLIYLFDLVIIKKTKYVVNKGTVLIIRVDAIGDFLLWLDSAKDLRRLYPKGQYYMVLLGNETWFELAQNIDYWDEVWKIDRIKFARNILYRWEILKKIRKAGFEIVIQPTISREFDIGDALICASGAPHRIGSIGDLCNMNKRLKSFADRWYTKLIPVSGEQLMELERNAEFMRVLGTNDFKAHVQVLCLSKKFDGVSIIDNYYVIFPGASSQYKRWPLQRFVALIKRIYQATGWVGIICGSQNEEMLGNVLEQSVNVPIKNYIGKTSLSELTKIISEAHLLVGNDTSAIHLAAAVSTPAVCIVGGGHFGRFLPYHLNEKTDRLLPTAVFHKMKCYGCNWWCVFSPSNEEAVPCITNVTVEDVWREVKIILSRNKFIVKNKT